MGTKLISTALAIFVMASGCSQAGEATHVPKKTLPRFVKCMQVSPNHQIAFERTDGVFLYGPHCIVAQDTIPIEGFDPAMATTTDIVVSPDGSHARMDNITRALSSGNEGETTPEVYHCVLVSFPEAAVKASFQQDCSGHWTTGNAWVNDLGIVVFQGD